MIYWSGLTKIIIDFIELIRRVQMLMHCHVTAVGLFQVLVSQKYKLLVLTNVLPHVMLIMTY